MAGDDDPPPKGGGSVPKIHITQPHIIHELNLSNHNTNYSGPPPTSHANNPKPVAPPPSISLAQLRTAAQPVLVCPKHNITLPLITQPHVSALPHLPNMSQPVSTQKCPTILAQAPPPITSQSINKSPPHPSLCNPVPPVPNIYYGLCSNPDICKLPSTSDDIVDVGVFQPSQPPVTFSTKTATTLPPKPHITEPANTTLAALSQIPALAHTTTSTGNFPEQAITSAAEPNLAQDPAQAIRPNSMHAAKSFNTLLSNHNTQPQANHATLHNSSYAHAALGLASFYTAEDTQPHPCLDSHNLKPRRDQS
ncbi:hypothetical protein LIER_41139 [Lithospermum erythrorhizon]|uniref:Uncharacterized protein n=1 Tax=Lithospermum erythrorhizon TaxID=34254 RepID=A0AAV3R615_LITER